MSDGPTRALTVLAAVVAALCACSSTSHHNVAHPEYGDAQYGTDLADCRRQNSTVVSIQGYDVQSQVTTDEAKVATCMTQRGWQAVGR